MLVSSKYQDDSSTLDHSLVIKNKLDNRFLPKVKYYIKDKSKFRELKEKLINNQVVLVSGLPGLGKSSFASEYARDRRKIKPNTLIRVIAADSKEAIQSEYLQLGLMYDDIASNNLTPENTKDKVNQKISQQVGKNGEAILVFDNAEKLMDSDVNYIKPYLEDIPNNIRIIVTSRDSTCDYLPKLNLQPFSEKQAQEYFKKSILSYDESIKHENFKRLFDVIASKNEEILPYTLSKVSAWFKKKISCNNGTKNIRIRKAIFIRKGRYF